MKKNYKLSFLLSLTLLLFFNKSYSQKDSIIKSDICVKKGKTIIDVFYGFPYVMGQYVKTVFISNNNSGNTSSIESVRNLNHIGGKFEYMLTNEIGIGLEYTYASVNINYFQEKSIVQNNQNVLKTYNYKATLYKQRALARVNYHFATSEKFDPYGTLGFGYKTSLLKSNNPDDQLEIRSFNSTVSNLFPISFRLGIGARYFFSENIGISMEAGIGGPTVQGGISVKF
jgi:outer membrane protein W